MDQSSGWHSVRVSSQSVYETCAFPTQRLSVAPWHRAVGEHGIDLTEAVAAILTPKTTGALPPAWRGEYTPERARRWVIERDGESPTFLVVVRSSSEPVGLMILHEEANEHDMLRHLRVGYVIKESSWGEGIASELVSGLVGWARSQPFVGSISGGVDSQNPASARVLLKNGFRLRGRDPTEGTVTYSIKVRS